MPILNLTPGQSIHYLDLNPKGFPTILLLHGLGANSSSWQLQFPALLEQGCRVLAPDAPGFGRSTYPGGGKSIAFAASSLARLLEELRTGPACVVGISMGGTHALQITLDYPQLVSRLVLVNTFARLRPERASNWMYFAFRFALVHILGLEVQARTVADRLFPDPGQEILRQALVEQISMADPRGYRAAMRDLGRFNVSRRLGEIRVPTLVITGANDSTISPQNQRQLAEGIPNVQQIVISEAGHAVIVERPEKFNKVLLDFLMPVIGSYGE